MTTTITIHGTGGKLVVDRQELKVYLREPRGFEDYVEGWNTRYITGLQKPVDFYLRGEEYSAQTRGLRPRRSGPATWPTRIPSRAPTRPTASST